MKERNYDVIIVGTGPAGMFAALELKKNNPKLNIVMFDMGPLRNEGDRDNLTSGWGGAGAFSDGKIILSPRVGGNLSQIVGEQEFEELMNYVDKTYFQFGARAKIIWGSDSEIEEKVREAMALDLSFTPTRTRHIGSDRTLGIVEKIRKYLQRRGVKIFLNTPVESFSRNSQGMHEVFTSQGIFSARTLIVVPGRSGADWLAFQAEKLGLKILSKEMSVDIGIRVEVPAIIMTPLTDIVYDPKIKFLGRTFGDLARTFCVCPQGFVAIEKYKDLLTTVNGHSFEQRQNRSPNTNFAILVSVPFTEPFREPIKYAKHISELANMLAGKVLVQRLGDLKDGRRSTLERIRESRDFIEPSLKEATPGDIAFAIPYRQMVTILEMIERLGQFIKGIDSKHTLLYAVEAKFYSTKIEMNQNFETAISGLYVGGDGSGRTRGLLQSSMTGVIIARDIAKKI